MGKYNPFKLKKAMNRSKDKTMIVLSVRDVINTFGGYGPPDGWQDDILNPPITPTDPQPFDHRVW